ncbi:MAG TPA: NAD(P)H-hydrate dehydratase [Actinomycetes bacterium]|nr:NAD(P)H-hydrate dehydratase [Actinomycetes bacterium]
MRTAHTADQVRAAEAPLLEALPEGALMARAAGGLAARCASLLGRVYGARVVLLVGAGNNGGDALHAGAALARRGARVDAVLLGASAHEAGLAALRRAGGRPCSAADAAGVLAGADLVVDGILGIGGRGGLRPEAAAVVAAVPQTAIVVAVDVPSGVDATTGEVPGEAVRADVTVTFGSLKAGLLVAPGADHAGIVDVVDIGLRPGPAALEALQAEDVAQRWPWPQEQGDKYARGVLGVHAGSSAYPGAGVLCLAGALGAGCGYVRVAATSGAAVAVRMAHPEAIVVHVEPEHPAHGVGRVQAWATGPGLGTGRAEQAGVRALLAEGLPTVLDADALVVLAADPGLLRGREGGPGAVLLTPHAGELARLLGVGREEVEQRRLEHARAAAERFEATVLLKGSTTLVAAPGEVPVRVNTTGTAWLGTAGSGDVLTGVAGSLLAAGRDARDAGSVAAWVHGLAARLASAGGPLTASRLAEALPRAVASLG